MDDAISTGLAIEGLVQRELAKLKTAKKPAPQPAVVEPSNEAIARQLEAKELPAARRDAAVIRKATAENELKRRGDETSWARARMNQPYENA